MSGGTALESSQSPPPLDPLRWPRDAPVNIGPAIPAAASLGSVSVGKASSLRKTQGDPARAGQRDQEPLELEQENEPQGRRPSVSWEQQSAGRSSSGSGCPGSGGGGGGITRRKQKPRQQQPETVREFVEDQWFPGSSSSLPAGTVVSLGRGSMSGQQHQRSRQQHATRQGAQKGPYQPLVRSGPGLLEASAVKLGAISEIPCLKSSSGPGPSTTASTARAAGAVETGSPHAQQFPGFPFLSRKDSSGSTGQKTHEKGRLGGSFTLESLGLGTKSAKAGGREEEAGGKKEHGSLISRGFWGQPSREPSASKSGPLHDRAKNRGAASVAAGASDPAIAGKHRHRAVPASATAEGVVDAGVVAQEAESGSKARKGLRSPKVKPRTQSPQALRGKVPEQTFQADLRLQKDSRGGSSRPGQRSSAQRGSAQEGAPAQQHGRRCDNLGAEEAGGLGSQAAAPGMGVSSFHAARLMAFLEDAEAAALEPWDEESRRGGAGTDEDAYSVGGERLRLAQEIVTPGEDLDMELLQRGTLALQLPGISGTPEEELLFHRQLSRKKVEWQKRIKEASATAVPAAAAPGSRTVFVTPPAESSAVVEPEGSQQAEPEKQQAVAEEQPRAAELQADVVPDLVPVEESHAPALELHKDGEPLQGLPGTVGAPAAEADASRVEQWVAMHFNHLEGAFSAEHAQVRPARRSTTPNPIRAREIESAQSQARALLGDGAGRRGHSQILVAKQPARYTRSKSAGRHFAKLGQEMAAKSEEQRETSGLGVRGSGASPAHHSGCAGSPLCIGVGPGREHTSVPSPRLRALPQQEQHQQQLQQKLEQYRQRLLKGEQEAEDSEGRSCTPRSPRGAQQEQQQQARSSASPVKARLAEGVGESALAKKAAALLQTNSVTEGLSSKSTQGLSCSGVGGLPRGNSVRVESLNYRASDIDAIASRAKRTLTPSRRTERAQEKDWNQRGWWLPEIKGVLNNPDEPRGDKGHWRAPVSPGASAGLLDKSWGEEGEPSPGQGSGPGNKRSGGKRWFGFRGVNALSPVSPSPGGEGTPQAQGQFPVPPLSLLLQLPEDQQQSFGSSQHQIQGSVTQDSHHRFSPSDELYAAPGTGSSASEIFSQVNQSYPPDSFSARHHDRQQPGNIKPKSPRSKSPLPNRS